MLDEIVEVVFKVCRDGNRVWLVWYCEEESLGIPINHTFDTVDKAIEQQDILVDLVRGMLDEAKTKHPEWFAANPPA